MHRLRAYIGRNGEKGLAMQDLMIGTVAALLGVALGYWLRNSAAKADKDQVMQRNDELKAVRAELEMAKARSDERAGFESLAIEREKTIAQMTVERDGLRADLQAKASVESQTASRISELEMELKNERQNMAEKIALLEGAKQTLANQFQALAGDILETKSKTFSETNKTELGTLLTPLRTQIEEFRKKVEEAQTDSTKGVTKLETLIGTLGGLNQQLSEEARNLTKALRGSSKAQGDWGELIVRNLLEKGACARANSSACRRHSTLVVTETRGRESRGPM